MTDAHPHASVGDVAEASSGADTDLAPGSRFGRYVLLDRVGVGGMGVVMSAYDPQLDRRIAIKLLASSRIEEQARLRLLREAQAMARLSHPNVVPVYDAGSMGGRVFITMEFVEGLTLRAWLEHEPRAWTEVLRTMRRAGLGLQAAHEAGLVHRDFKPDNVMVGDDGRVRVLDFGLARGGANDGALATQDAPEARQARDERALTTPLTSHGALLGTPAYMPPEQLEGLPVDARADQWSFCATLYEALYGSRPFEAQTVAASVVAMHNGELLPPPETSVVPDSVFTALARGLSVDPEARHPSVAALLEALEVRPPAARRRLVAGATVASAAVAGVLWWNASTEPTEDPACVSRAVAASEVWSTQAQQAGADAFANSTVGFRDEAWARSSDRLDDYVASWNEEAGRACRAATPETAEVDTLRAQCLDDRLRRLRSVVDAFADANDDVVRRSIETAFGLPPVAACADTVGLLARVRPPDDPAARAELQRLEDELETASAHQISGHYAEGRKLAQAVVDQARQLGHDPFTARALATVATFDRKRSDFESARDGLVEAFELAASARHDFGAASVAIELLFVLGYELRSTDAAQAWTTMATTMVTRAGQTDQELDASLRNAIATIELVQGEYEQARVTYGSALDIWEALPGEHPIQRAALLSNLGMVYGKLNRSDDAYDHFREALEIREATFGSEHPEFATSLTQLGIAEDIRGNRANARELMERGLAIKRATLPADHPDIADSVTNLGNLLLRMGESMDGTAVLEDALELSIDSRGPEHPVVATTLFNLAQAYAGLGRHEQSEASFRRALEIQHETLGHEHPEVVMTLVGLSALLLDSGRPQDALPLAKQSLAAGRAAFGPDHPALIDPWCILSRVHELGGRRAEALEAASNALATMERNEGDDFLFAIRRVELGKARWRLDDDRAAGRRMVEDAAAVMAKSPERNPDFFAETQAWLQAHPPPD